MTEHAANEHGTSEVHGGRKRRVARRRFLSGVGSGGLAAAAVVFGKPTAASAYDLNCCHLCFKPSISVSTCQNASRHYVWGCTADGGFLHCTCCERGATTATCSGVNASAGSCQYG